MKTKLFTLLFAIVASVGTMSANVTVDGIVYNLNATDLTAEVRSGGDDIDSIVIPENITYDNLTYSVTSIGNNAFYYYTNLTSVNIPNSVTSIGRCAFFSCTGLTSIEIPNSVTSIESSAFAGCTGLTSIEIPNSITIIAQQAFQYCTGLTSVSIGNSVSYIGQYPFNLCTSLTSVTINSNDIISKAYTTNSNIKSIFGVQVEEYVLGPNVKSIGSYAFYQCDSLSSVTIGDSITSIGVNAFTACAKLNSVTWNAKDCDDFTQSPFPANIKSFTFGSEVEKIPAYLCSSLDSIEIILIPNSVTSIGKYAFGNCSSLTSITIPNSVTSIGDDVLYRCAGLTHPVYNASNFVKLPVGYSGAFAIQSGITTICGGAFSECTGLMSISIPNSVTKIGNMAFSMCLNLNSISIPNNVTTIGNNAFRSCTSLTSVTIPNSVTTIGNNAFLGCSSMTSLEIPNSVRICAWRISLHNENLENVEAPTWFFDVAESNWANCPKHLQSVTINAGEINDNVFSVISRSYKTLTNLNIANATNTNIADEAFKGYYNLTSLALPSNLEHIGYMSVAECKNLQSIDIPASVTEISQSAFENCRSLKTITFGGQASSVPGLRNATATSASQLQTIGNWAFYNCHELQNLTIPEGVTSIGDGAFYGCTYLEELALPSSVQSMGDNTFALCSKLKKIVVNAPVPPSIQAKTFFDVKRQIPVFVPDESVSAYENDAYWQEFDIQGIFNMPMAIDQITNDSIQKATKILRNGQVLILRGDRTYTLTGAEVK